MSEESLHWYTQAGEPCHTINEYKSGLGYVMRNTTLRDARKMNLCPSVTSVLANIAKPALTNWMVDQGIMAALTMPRIGGESEADYIKRIKDDSKQQAIRAAQEGSRIHQAIERSYNGLRVPDVYVQAIV